jgi:hypothetical protein
LAKSYPEENITSTFRCLLGIIIPQICGLEP